METIEISATKSTPFINCNGQIGLVQITGESYPENSFDFYKPILEWIENFLINPSYPLQLELRLLYLNTSSTRCIIDILDTLQSAHDRGKSVLVRWYYEEGNDRSLEVAEEFREEVSIPFEIIATKE